MNLIRNIFFTLIIVLSGCNYSFLVKKDRILNVRSGYLLLYRDQQIFFPTKNIKDDDLLNRIEHLTGYSIYFDKESQIYRDISKKFAIEHIYKYESETVARIDTIGVIAVEIRSLPYHNKGKKELNELTVYHNHLSKTFKYYNTNNEGVWSVYPIFKSDLQQLNKYYN